MASFSVFVRRSTLLWVSLGLAVAAHPAEAQNPDLTYHTVPPCTVVDTRVAGGAFAVGEIRTYNAVGNGSFASQGGSATGCSVPGFSNGIAQAQAVELNIAAILPTGNGHIVANAADQPLAGSVVNFTASQNVANTTPVAVSQVSGVGDFKIQVNYSSAHVVIRVFGYYSKPVQTVYVHPVPGDHTASGTALLNAMSGITNASATKRYVIKLEPGIYDLGSTMLTQKNYVDLEGSGQQATVIQGVGNNDGTLETAVIKGGSSAEIRDLQVKAAGTSSLPSIAILVLDGADTRITNVTVDAGGGASNWAVRNRNANAVIEGSTLKAVGGGVAYGISSKGPGATVAVKRSVVEVTGTTSAGYGLGANQGGTYKEIRDVQVKVSPSSSGFAYGIYLYENAALTDLRVTASTVTVEGSGIGVYLQATSSPRLLVEQSQIRSTGAGGYGILSQGDVLVDHSEIAGEASTVDGYNVFIGATRLHGGPVSAVTATCAGVYDESFTFFPGTACP